MAGRIFTFILSVLFTLYMSVLYNSNGFLFVFYAEILIGSMLFIMNMILFFKLKIKLETKPVINKCGRINFELVLENRSILPSGKILLTLNCLDPYNMKQKKVVVKQWCSAKRTERCSYSFRDDEILSGNYIVSVKKAGIYDYLGFFKLNKHMKNKSEAEDVFQEVFLRLVKYKERIQGREHLKAWLLRVTVNCCKKQFDSAFRKKTVSIDRDVQSTDSYEMDLPENLIYEAVLRLPADYRSTVHLFYYEQYSVSEIAEMLELSESAVKTRLYRSRGMLKEALKGEFDCVGRI